MISIKNSRKIKILSLFAAFLVVQIHTCYGVGTVAGLDRVYRIFFLEGLYGFAVPFFFIVSGFFFMNRFDDTWRWWLHGIRKRLHSLLLPYVVWVLLFIMFTRFLLGRFEINFLTDFGITTVTPANGSMWYVKVLFVMCVLVPVFMPLLKFMKKHQRIVPVVYILGALMLGLPIPGFKTYWRAVFYFTLGMGIYFGIFDYTIRQLHKIRKWRLSIILLWMMILTLRFFCLPGFSTFWLYVPLLAVPSIWILYDVISRLTRVEISPSVIKICDLSFFVYCSHEIVIRFINLCPALQCSVCHAFITGIITFLLCCIIGICLRCYMTKLFIFLSGGRG